MGENSTMHDELKDLRSKVESSPEDIRLKKSMLGGYDCKEVDEYVKTLKQNMQQAQKMFTEKFQEVTSASSALTQERDVISRRLNDAEKKLKQADDDMNALNEQNKELENKIQQLIQQLGDMPTTEELQREFKETAEENAELKELLNEVTESRTQLISENSILKDKTEDLASALERTEAQNDVLRDKLTRLKVQKRNVVINTNKSIFEYQQRNSYNIEKIDNGIKDILNALESMQKESEDLNTQARKNIQEEEETAQEF